MGLSAKIVAAAALLVATMPLAASAGTFKIGDHVLVGSTQDTGTIIEVGSPQMDGGVLVKVHLDRLPPGFPTIGSWYDTAMSNVTVIGSGAAPAPQGVGPPGVPPPGPQGAINPQPRLPHAPAQHAANQVHGDAASCEQAIRANYPPGGADQTMTVSFLSFTMSAGQPYEAIYAGDLAPPAGRGHIVQALPVHAKFTVLTHYADANADDELRTYDAQYMCYRAPANGEWTVEMTSRVPGGETAQYIKKH